MKIILLGIALLLTPPAEARIPRSYSAKAAFVRLHACPSTGLHRLPCKGWVIDHVKPLACNGPDLPSNMAWQTIAEGRAKDKWERIGCKAGG
jgi:hypothetical protein